MSASETDWLVATGLPACVGGVMSTRAGGVSRGPFAGLNLRPPGMPSNEGEADVPANVVNNQNKFAAALEGAQPVWLDQVHGTSVLQLTAQALAQGFSGLTQPHGLPQADASFTTERGLACTVLVADCLPVLLSAEDGSVVAAAHAGWRGLAGGVLEATLAAMSAATGVAARDMVAWMGASIGPKRFEVGPDVRDAFGQQGHPFFQVADTPGKWWADLPGLARWRLAQAGVRRVDGGDWCTASTPSRFFSFRRDRVTGRHAAAIWRR